ncbi:LysR family transcriptional regulator [Thiohalorhabdus methylotrophus]|uniref:HTH-type transcriptional regulator MetR n=1 Tax=Thiohalorhabdus methylotrophus TaxID=3242694 RepID=A0ABV4TV76_9GAMM
MIERHHLHLLSLLRETGSLERTAGRLHLTPSALSHRVRELEDRLGVSLYHRRSRPLRFTQAGDRLLSLADRFLPEIQSAEQELASLAAGEAGRLYIALECHSCFDWLIPTLDTYRRQWPEVSLDLTVGFRVEPLPALVRGDVDLVITSDPQDLSGITYLPLFRYQVLLAAPPDHPLAGRPWADPSDLAGETLITYPVERQRLDIFTRFLGPAGIEPAQVRTTELTAMLLQLVASGRGFAALPAWAMEDHLERGSVTGVPLGEQGMAGTLYMAIRQGEAERPYMTAFTRTAAIESTRVLTHIRPVPGNDPS